MESKLPTSISTYIDAGGESIPTTLAWELAILFWLLVETKVKMGGALKALYDLALGLEEPREVRRSVGRERIGHKSLRPAK